MAAVGINERRYIDEVGGRHIAMIADLSNGTVHKVIPDSLDSVVSVVPVLCKQGTATFR